MGKTNNKVPVSFMVVWFPVVLILLLLVVHFLKTPSNRGVQSNTCITNLRMINAAKEQWALEHNKTNGTAVTENELKPYMRLDSKENFPQCPGGGIYSIGKIGELPTCSLGTNVIPTHVLP
jgi:hypothetical protein